MHFREGFEGSIVGVILVQRDRTQSPAGGAEEFRERVDAHCILRALCKQRDEVVGKGPINIVGDNQKVWTLCDRCGQLAQDGVRQFRRWWIAWVDEAKYLDVRVQQFVDLRI